MLGYLKGKSAIHIARTYAGKRRNFVGQHFWARGYWVSTVGHNEAAVRKYIQEQEKEDQRLDQLGLFEGESRFERFTISSLRLCVVGYAIIQPKRQQVFKIVDTCGVHNLHGMPGLFGGLVAILVVSCSEPRASAVFWSPLSHPNSVARPRASAATRRL